MNAARQTLETVGFLRGGRIGGFLDGRTSFWLTKREHEVAMIGEDGQPRRVAQWLIELEAPIDLTRLLAVDGDETRLDQGNARGRTARRGAPLRSTRARSTPITRFQSRPRPADRTDREDDGRPPAIELPAEPPAVTTSPAAVAVTSDALTQVFERLNALQIPREKFDLYAKRKYGAGWNRNPNGIRRVLAAIEAFKASPEDLLAAVEADVVA